MPETFRILRHGLIPFAMVEPHAAQALSNHGQSLERLNDRGGLDPVELLCVLLDRPYRRMDEQVALREINRLRDELGKVLL